MASTVPAKNKNSRIFLATAGVAVIAAGAYGLGRVYPPLGETAGTIAPAERYRSSQVDASGVSLGDTEIPKLMQTDAFEMMVKDPDFRALGVRSGVRGAGQQFAGVRGASPKSRSQFAALAANQKAFAAAVKGRGRGQRPRKGKCRRHSRYMATNPQGFEALAQHPQAVAAMADASAGVRRRCRAIRKHSRRWPITPRPSRSSRRMRRRSAAAAANPAANAAMASNAQAFKALAANAQRDECLVERSQAFLGDGPERPGDSSVGSATQGAKTQASCSLASNARRRSASLAGNAQAFSRRWPTTRSAFQAKRRGCGTGINAQCFRRWPTTARRSRRWRPIRRRSQALANNPQALSAISPIMRRRLPAWRAIARLPRSSRQRQRSARCSIARRSAQRMQQER